MNLPGAVIKRLFDQVKGIEIWMAAFPLLRCFIEGHDPLDQKINQPSPAGKFCKRCNLVYWE